VFEVVGTALGLAESGFVHFSMKFTSRKRLNPIDQLPSQFGFSSGFNFR
jgi:hypothetical protein